MRRRFANAAWLKLGYGAPCILEKSGYEIFRRPSFHFAQRRFLLRAIELRPERQTERLSAKGTEGG
jgi:hypothetical protein